MGAFYRKYGTAISANTAYAIRIPIIKRGVVDYAVSADFTPSAGDVKITKDGGATANIATLPVAITMGNGAVWEFIFSATEMQAGTIVVTVVDAATKAVEDQAFIIETYGNASAMYQWDMSLANLPADAKAINAVSTSSVTAVNPNVGTTQPQNFTGTGASALVKGDAVDIGGTAQTGRDLGASVLLSSGTGTGQLDFTSGVIKANLAQILNTALTETAGLLAAGFKKFFNVATPTGTVNSLPDAVPGATGGVFIAGTNAATTVTTSFTTTFTGNLTGSVTGAVGSVAGNVGGNVVGSVGSIAGVTFPTNFASLVITGAGVTRAFDDQGNAIASLSAQSTMQTSINNLNNLSALANLFAPSTFVRPSSGSIVYPLTFVVKDSEGHLVDVDSNTVTLTATNAAGTDRSANLSSVTHAGTGEYTFTYTVSSAHADEGLRITAAGTVQSASRKAYANTDVADADSLSSLAAIQAQTDKLVFNGSGNVAASAGGTDFVHTAGKLWTLDGSGNALATHADIVGLPAATRDVSNSSPAAGSWGEASRNADAKAAVLIDTIGAPAGASVSADVAAVKADTGTVLTNLTTALSRLGAFTGSGVNTVLGFFRALMSKAATLPSDVGGTFDPADDSAEAIRDHGDAAWLTATVVSINGIDAATANKIADHGRRRTQANVKASSDGDTLDVHSLYGTIQQIQASNLVDNAGKLTIKHPDASAFAQLTVTSAPNADEITGVSG